ncbi:hypothetical protein BRADI_4g20976v3 [Brachypodium distachyon]|uniref:Uncharacterized protein n=1 Tax=Brachypodium distachyon TaxID=15368 RepID=A0A2K2CP37_BRADI|nr:hypothetical protein BRADI_4g20976v3 [Brachypodium distachyon]
MQRRTRPWLQSSRLQAMTTMPSPELGRMVPATTFLAPCHGGVPRSGARTIQGVVFVNNQPASARHHTKDEHHVLTPAQCEASSSSIANRCPPEHRHARRAPHHAGAVFINGPSTSAWAPSCAMVRTWVTSTQRAPQAELYFVEQGNVFIYKLADVHLNTAAGSGTVVGDISYMLSVSAGGARRLTSLRGL